MQVYNRYIPQRDGSYRRSPTPEPQASRPSAPRTPQPAYPPPAPPAQECAPSALSRPQHSVPPQGVGSFLKNLLPKNFDTADLLIVLLILLMAGDCQEDQNTALLTLALYFFL